MEETPKGYCLEQQEPVKQVQLELVELSQESQQESWESRVDTVLQGTAYSAHGRWGCSS